jgi:hypothetical protein
MRNAQFHVAAFAADGSLVGQGTRHLDALSEKWMTVCAQMLPDGVPSAAVCVPVEGLSHLEVRYTRAGRTGIATFYANRAMAASAILMEGTNPERDAQVQSMFQESLRGVVPAAEAFGALSTIAVRPLYAVVAWGNPAVSDKDEELIQELSTHFAAAFLLGPQNAPCPPPSPVP